MLLWTLRCMYLFELVFPIFWIYTRSGIAWFYGSSIFSFWGTSILFSIVSALYLPRVPFSLHPLQHLLFVRFFLFSFLATLWPSELPGQRSNPCYSCDLSHSCGNARPLTQSARPGIKSTSPRSQGTADPTVPQQALLWTSWSWPFWLVWAGTLLWFRFAFI